MEDSQTEQSSLLPYPMIKYLSFKAMTTVIDVVALRLLIPKSYLPRIYQYLDVGDAPHQAELVVVLGGNPDRVLIAADLYHEHYAPMILISGHLNDIETNTRTLANMGISDSRLASSDPASNTWNEAQHNLKYVRDNHIHSALIVTNAPHIRRAHAVYTYLNQDKSIQLTFAAARPEGIVATNWTTDSPTRHLVLREYLKIGFYFLRYGIRAWY